MDHQYSQETPKPGSLVVFFNLIKVYLNSCSCIELCVGSEVENWNIISAMMRMKTVLAQ
jgi:hypothetical protein